MFKVSVLWEIKCIELKHRKKPLPKNQEFHQEEKEGIYVFSPFSFWLWMIFENTKNEETTRSYTARGLKFMYMLHYCEMTCCD